MKDRNGIEVRMGDRVCLTREAAIAMTPLNILWERGHRLFGVVMQIEDVNLPILPPRKDNVHRFIGQVVWVSMPGGGSVRLSAEDIELPVVASVARRLEHARSKRY